MNKPEELPFPTNYILSSFLNATADTAKPSHMALILFIFVRFFSRTRPRNGKYGSAWQLIAKILHFL
jgi:hypothetical protein